MSASPATTSSIESLTLRASDGTALSVRVWPRPATVKAEVLIVHGYADHAARYDHTAERLARDGYASIGYDQRGHGQSAGQRGACLHFSEYLNDFDLVLKLAAERAAGAPLFVLGHSFGSGVVLRRLLSDVPLPAKIACAATSSPFLDVAMKVPAVKIAAGRLLSRIWPTLSLKNEIPPGGVSHDPAIVAAYANDPMVFKIANARWFTEASAAQEYVIAHASEISVPLLVTMGGADPIASVGAVRRFIGNAGSKARYVEYAGLFHELLNEAEPDREKVVSEILKFFDEHAKT